MARSYGVSDNLFQSISRLKVPFEEFLFFFSSFYYYFSFPFRLKNKKSEKKGRKKERMKWDLRGKGKEATCVASAGVMS